MPTQDFIKKRVPPPTTLKEVVKTYSISHSLQSLYIKLNVLVRQLIKLKACPKQPSAFLVEKDFVAKFETKLVQFELYFDFPSSLRNRLGLSKRFI